MNISGEEGKILTISYVPSVSMSLKQWRFLQHVDIHFALNAFWHSTEKMSNKSNVLCVVRASVYSSSYSPVVMPLRMLRGGSRNII